MMTAGMTRMMMKGGRRTLIEACLLLLVCGLGRETRSFSTPALPGTFISGEAEARGGESCNFPGRWEGNWFQSGVHETISILGQVINTKGRCLEADGEKYLVFSDREKCYRCVVFHEKHPNVLQYKETFCISDRKELKGFCGTITGDASLYSLFRLDPVPIDCPFQGPLTFTYNRGHGDCRFPLSTIESCIHPSRLNFNYQACPDMPGTESASEELQCLATWKEGSSRYLLGLMQYRHHASYEERFRCFVYERSKKGGGGPGKYVPSVGGAPGSASLSGSSNNTDSNIIFRVSQSGDATCNGLTPSEGSRVMSFRRAPLPKPCQFPSWLLRHSQWYTLDMRLTYTFEMGALRVSNSTAFGTAQSPLVMSAGCYQIVDNHTTDKVVLILHTTMACENGYICTAIYRRDGHIMELQMGNMTRRAEDACHVLFFNQTQLSYVTLVSSTPETRQCPYLGRFLVTGLARDSRILTTSSCSTGYSSLQVGCSKLDSMLLRSDCRPRIMQEYACHGWWEEMGLSYLVTTPLSRASSTPRRYCFVFRESFERIEGRGGDKAGGNSLKLKGKSGSSSSVFSFREEDGLGGEESNFSVVKKRVLHFSSVTDSCSRNIIPGIEGALAFNVSSQGECSYISSNLEMISPFSRVSLLIFSFWIMAFSHFLEQQTFLGINWTRSKEGN